jgi:predicted XRE-type DNA-binding protein
VKEVWKTVVGRDRYEVSSIGRVRRVARIGLNYKNRHGRPHFFSLACKLIKSCLDKDGYPRLSLRDSKGNNMDFKIHRLVAMAFHADTYFDGAIVNHKNSCRTDNRVSNLEWVTYKQNTIHSWAHGNRKRPVGELNGAAKLSEEDVTQIRSMLKEGILQKEISKKFGVTQSAISSIKRRRLWAHVL